MSAERAPQDNNFGRAVLLINPYSTKADHSDVRSRIGDIDAMFPGDVRTLHTTGETDKDQDMLRNNLQYGDVLCIAGGDGTINPAIGVLTEPDFAKLEVPIFPLWCGNGNDLAHILNGGPNRMPASEIIRTGRVAKVSPISWQETSSRGHEKQRIAAVYAGIGVSARVSSDLNMPSHRERLGYNIAPLRFMYEGLLAASSLRNGQPFEIETDGGDIRTLYDLTYANGPRMAKVGKPPVGLEESRIHIAELTSVQFKVTSKALAQLATGRLPRIYIEEGQQDAFTLRTPTVGHFDAEPAQLAAGTHIEVQHHHTPFYALTTKA